MATFAQAFAKARKEKGAGKTFTWNGKTYTTDRADDQKKSKAEKAPPKRPAPPPMSKTDKARAEAKATPPMSKTDKARAEAKATPRYARIGPGYGSKIGPKIPSAASRLGMAIGKKVGRMMGK